MEVRKKEEGSKGKYYIEQDGQLVGEMTYTMAGDALMIIDHTHVDESFRGKGIGDILLERLIADARLTKTKVLPLCPFASAAISKDKTLQDVLG